MGIVVREKQVNPSYCNPLFPDFFPLLRFWSEKEIGTFFLSIFQEVSHEYI